ncbi:uncharacterized protein BDCG_16460 [Blastomyces dermatitidis ER-3]|uniref:Uncharacterized protein n=1 Tax=Ajellomyces dermatitidis (strain ER-3 / ATCC MYA-2586) TaxID=559297 RepID=A0ABP2ESZ1_AJEDR|nr:uncharacterized protein BDCG_16460 [Blastomyces dermatitidis ER-3]EEQ86763.2 hypothetical protein BDCG_16460 [Blastomyces dermatitidis ER-3]
MRVRGGAAQRRQVAVLARSRTGASPRGEGKGTAGPCGPNPADADAPAGRRDDTSLQGTATTAAAAREAGGGVAMRAVLPRLIDAAASNLAFLAVTEAAAAP